MSELIPELKRQAIQAENAGLVKASTNTAEWEAADLIEKHQQRITVLENVIGHSLREMEYAAFNLCENIDLSTRSKVRVVESTCPETSLLIAIRDLKEALQPPKENDNERFN